MKHSKLHAGIISVLLSFFLSFATVGCMVTGLQLRAGLWSLALGCLLLSIVFTVLLSLKWGGRITAAIAALLTAAVLLTPAFRQQFLSMLRDILALYQFSFGFTLPEFLQAIPNTPHTVPLLSLAAIISIACSFTLLRRCTAALAIMPALLCFATCFAVIDTVPALELILLWFFSLILLLMTHPVRLQNPLRGIQVTRLLALPVAVAVLALSLLLPQATTNIPTVPADSFETLWNWALSKLPFIGTTADGDMVIVFTEAQTTRVNLGGLGPRIPVSIPIMEVTPEFTGNIYLREQDFDRYTGTAWESDPNRSETNFHLPSLWANPDGNVDIRTYGRRDYYFLPAYPDTAPTLTGGVLKNPAYQQEYSFRQTSMPADWQALWRRGAHASTPKPDERYLRLPEDTLRQARAILADIEHSTLRDQLTVVEQIAAYVKNIGSYDLNTAPMPDQHEDFAIWFLTEAETGYCVHYATAATVLLRAAGIPARYVEGYMTHVNAGKTTVVRENRAHAWVEYFLDGVGWVTLDPTPPDDNTDAPPTTTTRPSSSSTTPPGPTSSTTTRPTTQPTTTLPSTSQTTVPTQPSGNGPGIGDGNGSHDAAWMGKLLWVLLILGCAVLTVQGQYALRRRWIHARLHRGKANTQTLARYKEARRLARLSKLPLPDELTALAEKACFSQHRITREEVRIIDGFIKQCTAAMQETSPLHRLYLRYIHAAY